MTHYVSAQVKGNPTADGSDTREHESLDDARTWGDNSLGALRATPTHVQWVQSGSSAVTTGGHLEPTDEGRYNNKARAVIDLSSMLSDAKGMQISQEKIFYIDYIAITVANSDTGNNNEESASYRGKVRFYTPTKQRIKAYRMYRRAWKSMRRALAAVNPLFSTTPTYKALRLGHFVQYAAGGGQENFKQVAYQSDDPFSDVDSSKSSLSQIFIAYDKMKTTLAASGGMNTLSLKNNQLWRRGKASAPPQSITWCAGVSNPKSGGPGAGHQQWVMYCGKPISVMNGLLTLEVEGSTTTNSWTGASWADEQHVLQVDIGVVGWSGIA